jgi:ATP-dependent Clp protease adaptor protein ClpS
MSYPSPSDPTHYASNVNPRIVNPRIGILTGYIFVLPGDNRNIRRRKGLDSGRGVYKMTATKIKKEKGTRTEKKARPEPPWNVILHNDWDNSMPKVVVILKKIIPGMTLKKATRIMWEAHSTGKALVKSCHKELAELYEERLLAKGLTASIEPGD